MSRRRDDLLYRKVETLEEALEYIEKLKNRIKKDKESKGKLKSANKSLAKAWTKTEYYLDEVTGSKSLSEVIATAKDDGKLSTENDECPKCHKHTIERMVFSGFNIVLCEECDYRAREDEIITEED